MPIDIDLLPNGRVSVAIIENQHLDQLTLMMSSLLSSQYEREKRRWTLTWPDFCLLRDRMATARLTDGRSATEAAYDWITLQQDIDQSMEEIKEGKHNNKVQGLEILRTNLYEDQVTGVSFLMSRDRAVLADEMGVGKSIQLLATFAMMKSQGKASHALVVCPNSVKQGWIKEVAKHTKLSVKMLGNKPAETIKEFGLYAQKRTDVLVVHYDAMVAPSRKQKLPTEEDVKGIKPASGKAAVAPRRAVWSPLVDELLRLPWDVLIYDEAHQLKNTDAKRTQACLHLSDKARTNQKKPSRLYLVTGTPISETPLDAWAILKFLAPELLPGTYSKFENYFSRKETKQIGFARREVQEIVGYRNLSELKVLLQRLMIRRLKIDIKGMPPKVEQVRYLQMTDDQRKLYTDIKKGVYDAVVQDPNDKLSLDFAMTKCLRLRQVLNSPKLVGRDGASAKHAALDELLDELLQDPIAKVVVWTEWRAAIDLLYERYQKQYGCIKLIGGTSQEDLSYWSKNWDTMPERIAIGIPAFGGTGVDFLSRCRTAIYMEPPYSTIQFRQSMDRIHRRTNTTSTDPIEMLKSSPATLVFMQCEDTIDELVFKVLAGKGGIVDAMLVPDEKLVQIGKADLLKYLQ